ncbi:winged helix-turn-helix domain-containing protein [Candidatus Pacearchaeota archaeon]|jgi:predicted transcriptional regulator|nr:winged helix-turn-helix domain-containing protein [Candidatus Pacearchaeota archaeon]
MKRRSRLEMKADILRSLSKRDLTKTDISNIENIYSTTVSKMLHEMQKHELVSEFRGDWHLKQKGVRLLKRLEKIEEMLG